MQSVALSPERDGATIKDDNDSFDPCYTQDFAYDCYAKLTITIETLISIKVTKL